MRKDIITGIYCIENKINQKKYIGQSVNIYDRWSKHKSELNKNSHDNDYLQKSWNKYGEESFLFYILEECNKDELDEKENFYIDLYNSMNEKFGYNLKSGGQNGCSIVSEEVREKMSNSIKNAYTNELKEKRRKDALKQWSDPNIKEKICGKNNGMYGKTHTKEAREKIANANRGRISPRRNLTPVLCVELNKVYECAAEAVKEINTRSSNIFEACEGIKRKTAGGYHWQFMENNIG